MKPGIPPAGWRDITPYFGEVPETSISAYGKKMLQYGYLLRKQTVVDKGLRYRRVAVALAPHIPGITTAKWRDLTKDQP